MFQDFGEMRERGECGREGGLAAIDHVALKIRVAARKVSVGSYVVHGPQGCGEQVVAAPCLRKTHRSSAG